MYIRSYNPCWSRGYWSKPRSLIWLAHICIRRRDLKKIKKWQEGKKFQIRFFFFFLMKNSDSALLRNKRNAVFLWLLGVHIRVKETNTDLPLLTGEPTTVLGGTHLHVPSHSLHNPSSISNQLSLHKVHVSMPKTISFTSSFFFYCFNYY